MSQENVESSVRRAYDAFSRGDFDTAIEIAHPEFEFFPLAGQAPLRGAAAMRAWMEPDALVDARVEVQELRINGDKVLIRQTNRARGASSCIEMDIESWVVWTLDDGGLATRMEAFSIDQEGVALEAAGLSE